MKAADIREHMEVYDSSGNRLWSMDRLEGRSIKLTRAPPQRGRERRHIPLEWQAHSIEEGERFPEGRRGARRPARGGAFPLERVEGGG